MKGRGKYDSLDRHDRLNSLGKGFAIIQAISWKYYQNNWEVWTECSLIHTVVFPLDRHNFLYLLRTHHDRMESKLKQV